MSEVRERPTPIVWKAIVFLLGGIAVADSLGAFGASYGSYFWGYFTNICTLATTLYYFADTIWLAGRFCDAQPVALGAHFASPRAAEAESAVYQARCIGMPGRRRIWTRTLLPVVKHALMLAEAITMLVGHFMLGFRISPDVMVNVDLLIMHYIVPVMVVADWLLFDKKGGMRVWEPLAWLAFPLAYFVALEVLVNVFGVYMGGVVPAYGMYPYPFLQAEVLGWQTVASTVALMLVAFAALGYVILAVDRLMARKREPRPI